MLCSENWFPSYFDCRLFSSNGEIDGRTPHLAYLKMAAPAAFAVLYHLLNTKRFFDCSDDGGEDAASVAYSLATTARQKGESAEDRRARKNAVKEVRKGQTRNKKCLETHWNVGWCPAQTMAESMFDIVLCSTQDMDHTVAGMNQEQSRCVYWKVDSYAPGKHCTADFTARLPKCMVLADHFTTDL